jgi:hypothetical protein
MRLIYNCRIVAKEEILKISGGLNEKIVAVIPESQISIIRRTRWSTAEGNIFLRDS